jgi:hypothetical protein
MLSRGGENGLDAIFTECRKWIGGQMLTTGKMQNTFRNLIQHGSKREMTKTQLKLLL